MNTRAAIVRLKRIPWRIACSFFLLGLINNVLYVIILSAALDLVGAQSPKSLVLLANILPAVLVKLVAPYFFDDISYTARVLGVVLLNILGMTCVSLAPGMASQLCGIAMASAASGAGEITFLQLSTRHRGPFALAAWSSGTGAAGIVGGVMYVACTTWARITPKKTLLASSALPLVMAVSYFVILPRAPARCKRGLTRRRKNSDESQYSSARTSTESESASDNDPLVHRSAEVIPVTTTMTATTMTTMTTTTRRKILERCHKVKPLLVPYMLPLFLVYFAEYTINQGLSPTLLFDIKDMPFSRYRDVYPTYATIYQVGVFLSRSSSPFLRIRQLYMPAIGQCGLLLVMLTQALFFYIPTIQIIFGLILLEGIFGGLVYVNAFHNVSQDSTIEEEDREFSVGVIGVADSFGILAAALASLWLELAICYYQVNDGRPWCRLE